MGRTDTAAVVVRTFRRRQTASHARSPLLSQLRHASHPEHQPRAPSYVDNGVRAALHHVAGQAGAAQKRARRLLMPRLQPEPYESAVPARVDAKHGDKPRRPTGRSVHGRRRHGTAGKRCLRCSVTLAYVLSLAVFRREVVPSHLEQIGAGQKSSGGVRKLYGSGFQGGTHEESYFGGFGRQVCQDAHSTTLLSR